MIPDIEIKGTLVGACKKGIEMPNPFNQVWDMIWLYIALLEKILVESVCHRPLIIKSKLYKQIIGIIKKIKETALTSFTDLS